ncbi:MAG: amidohydrolase family protein [Candidatus Riflebacteria bacterium]|nr:amidohydrolase family protein [Candidatus Riflebacteria bacterium]
MLGLDLPRSLYPRAGWRDLGLGRLEVWCRGDPTDLPWYSGVAGRTGRLMLHHPAGAEPLVAGADSRFSARIQAPAGMPLVPVWFGGEAPPDREASPYILAIGLAALEGRTDVHAHVGSLSGQCYPPELISALVAEAHVGSAWVSNLDGATGPQAEVNRRVVTQVADRPELEPVFWADPVQGLDRECRSLLEGGGFVALKFHPELNGYSADDRRVEPYLGLAGELGLPALFHTQQARLSHPSLVAGLARRFPRVRFIMGHTGLWGAQEEALACLRQGGDNLVGDLAWFHRIDLLVEEIRVNGPGRFVFGSDAPVDGEESYQQYLWILWRIDADLPLLKALFVDAPARLRRSSAGGR